MQLSSIKSLNYVPIKKHKLFADFENITKHSFCLYISTLSLQNLLYGCHELSEIHGIYYNISIDASHMHHTIPWGSSSLIPGLCIVSYRWKMPDNTNFCIFAEIGMYLCIICIYRAEQTS